MISAPILSGRATGDVMQDADVVRARQVRKALRACWDAYHEIMRADLYEQVWIALASADVLCADEGEESREIRAMIEQAEQEARDRTWGSASDLRRPAGSDGLESGGS